MRIQKGYEILKTEQIVFVLKKTGEYMTLKSSFSRCPYVIVLFDYMDFPKNEQARNLRCYNNNMELKWIAEHPTNAINDCYTQIKINVNTLEANDFAGYFWIGLAYIS